MQIAEKNHVSLRALKGGLAPLSLRLTVGPSASSDPDFEAAHDALRHALAPLRPDLRVEATPVLEGDGYAVALRASAASAGLTAPVSLHRIRSFFPAVKAQQRRLDVLFVSPAADAATGGPALIDAACRVAHAYGRRHVTVLASLASPGDTESLPAQHGFDVNTLDAGACARALVSSPDTLDVVVAPRDVVGILIEVAAALAGSDVLSTRVDCDAGGLRATAAFAGDDALPSLPGLILAAADLMVLGGHVQAARQVSDALCRALEEGVRCAEFDVTHPYARLVDDAGFADAVVERLGSTPRYVASCFPRAHGDARPRPRMRVIDGGR